MDASTHFKDKKITVMGLGLLGRGVGDAKYLAEQGAELIITDLKSAEELASSVAELKAFPDIKYTLGEHRLEDFQGRDLILKAAGVPLDSIYIEEARKQEIPIRMSADLFAEISGIPVIGVTGTRGKSTTAHMIAAILEQAGKKVLLGGNIRGVSTLALLDEVEGGGEGEEVAVMELDSWQLQGWGEAHMSPHIGVFTTFYPDHLNYYGGSLDAYLRDKANIFLHQIETDTLICGSQAIDIIREQYQDEILAHLFIANEDDLPKEWKLQIPGEHNRYDAALAWAAARAAGIEDETIRAAIENFQGVPGRLELVAEHKGVKFYNDTTATTPEATMAALSALDGNVILIMGGADKNLDMNKLLVEIPKRTKRAILLAGSGTNRVLEFLPGASVFDSLKATVDEAIKSAQPGDSILLSPAFASFGMFKNEYDRGDQFNALVKGL